MAVKDLIREQRFLEDVERGIRDANLEIIHERISPITLGNLMPFATSVARLRARYLEAAFRFSEKSTADALEDSEIEELRRNRRAFEEARDAFEALRHAIERGYVELGDAEN